MGTIVEGVYYTALWKCNGRTIAKASSGNMFAVWADAPDGSTQKSIKIKKSTDGGMTWGDAETIDSPSGAYTGCYAPAIAIDSDDTIYVVYRKQVTSSTLKICLGKKVLEGSWSLSDITAAEAGINSPSIAVDSEDHVHVTYQLGSHPDFYYLYSENGGSSWSSPYKVNGLLTGYDVCDLAIDSNDFPHIAWLEYDNGDCMHSYYDGADWHDEVIGVGVPAGDYWVVYWDRISIAIDSADFVHITTVKEAGIGDGDYTEILSYFTNRTSSWVEKTIEEGVVDEDEIGIESISVSADGTIHIFWSMIYVGKYKHSYSTDNGLNFSVPEEVETDIDYDGSSLWANWPSTAKLSTGCIGVYTDWTSGSLCDIKTTVTSNTHYKTITGILDGSSTLSRLIKKIVAGEFTWTGLAQRLNHVSVLGILNLFSSTNIIAGSSPNFRTILTSHLLINGNINRKTAITIGGILSILGIIIRKAKFTLTGILDVVGSFQWNRLKLIGGLLTASGLALKKTKVLRIGSVSFIGVGRKTMKVTVVGIITSLTGTAGKWVQSFYPRFLRRTVILIRGRKT